LCFIGGGGGGELNNKRFTELNIADGGARLRVYLSTSMVLARVADEL
jgi:hypothetical protein